MMIISWSLSTVTSPSWVELLLTSKRILFWTVSKTKKYTMKRTDGRKHSGGGRGGGEFSPMQDIMWHGSLFTLVTTIWGWKRIARIRDLAERAWSWAAHSISYTTTSPGRRETVTDKWRKSVLPPPCQGRLWTSALSTLYRRAPYFRTFTLHWNDDIVSQVLYQLITISLHANPNQNWHHLPRVFFRLVQ